jgi:hypothetical protein
MVQNPIANVTSREIRPAGGRIETIRKPTAIEVVTTNAAGTKKLKPSITFS